MDLSAGVREQNDYTVFVMGGRVKDKIHIIDCKRVRVMEFRKIRTFDGNDGRMGNYS